MIRTPPHSGGASECTRKNVLHTLYLDTTAEMCIRTQEDNAGRETMNIGSIFLLFVMPAAIVALAAVLFFITRESGE